MIITKNNHKKKYKLIFFENLKRNPNKLISKDCHNSLSWKGLISKANNYANKFKEIENNIIPIIVDRTVNTPASILGCIFSKKNICTHFSRTTN